MDALIQKFPRLETCCLCSSIEAGVKIVGWGSMVGCTFELLSLVMLLIDVVQSLYSEHDKYSLKVALSVGIILILMSLAHIVLAVVLLLGVYHDQLRKVRLWLQMTLVLYIIGVLLTLLGMTAMIVANHSVEQILLALLFGSLEIGVPFYCISVVKSYYNSKQSEFEPPKL